MLATLTPENVGRNLRRLLKESKYSTQAEFAKVMGKDARTVRRWLHSGVDKLDDIIAISNVLEVDVEALLF